MVKTEEESKMKVKYIDNIEILNELRKINALTLLDQNIEIVQDIDDKNHYAVQSGKDGSFYEVMFLNMGSFCGCKDFLFFGDKKGFKCKHIQAIEILREQKKHIKKGVLNL